MGIGSKSDCLKVEKVGGVLVGTVVQDPGDFRFRDRPEGREGRTCGGRGDCVRKLRGRVSRQSKTDFRYFSVKKVARLSASQLAEVQEDRVEDDLRCSRLLIVFQRESGLSEEEDWSNTVFRCKYLFVVSVSERSEGGPVYRSGCVSKRFRATNRGSEYRAEVNHGLDLEQR